MSRPRSASSPQRWLMSNPCAAAHYRNAPSSAASRVVLVRKIRRRAMVLTTASRMPSEARLGHVSSLPMRPIWSGNKSILAASFVGMWTRCGRHANNGQTVNWRMSRPPPERLKKEGPSGSPSRNRRGNRNSLRFWRGWRSGFRSRGDGGAATGSAAGRARTRATTERRYFRSCRPGTALLLRSASTVSRPSREDV